MFGSSGFGGFGQQNQNNQQQQQQQQPGQQQQGGGLFGAAGGGGFGANTATNTGGFGQPGATSGFGAPSQPTSLFGQQPQQQQQQPAQTGFGFGTTSAAPPAFGAAAVPKPAFGATGGGFGSTAPAAGSGGFTFGSSLNQSTPAFGAGANAGGGFGAKPAGGLFGSAPATSQPQTGGFGAPSGGMFGGAAPLGATTTGGMPTAGSSNPPYTAFSEKEPNSSVTNQYQSITCMPAYRDVSFEELRLQDYQQGRKSGNAAPGAASTGGFGFGANTGSTFGQQQPAASGFGAQPQPTQTGGGLFSGAAQPAQNNLFGATQQPQQAGGLFGQQQPQQQQPATGGLFGSNPQPSTGGGLFGQPTQQPQQSTGGGLFGSTAPSAGTGFSFGGASSNPTSASTGFSFGANNNQPQQQQQNKPLFGGFGASSSQPATGPGAGAFNFGATNPSQQQPQQQQPAGSGFGGGAGFSFGNTQQQKPGGLFGNTGQPAISTTFGGFGTSAPVANAPKPAFSFGGGFGASSGAGTGQTAAPTTGGGLFGSAQAQPTSQPGGLFGGGGFGANGSTGFGQNQQQPGGASGTTFGAGGFGSKSAATGGLFGQSTAQSQPQTGTTGFGGNLFGANNQNKPGGFGTGSSLFGQNQQQNAGGTRLFGQSQPAGAGSSLFGQSQPAGVLSASTGIGGGGGLFGQSQGQQQQQQPSLQASIDQNPYGTDTLFGAGQGSAAQPPLPFNVAPKKKPPIVAPFRSSPRNAGKISRLRGASPAPIGPQGGARESTPGLGTPGRGQSPGLFRGLSDEQALTPQAFVTRPSVKRLVLNDSGNTSFSRSMRAGSAALGESPAAGDRFLRSGTAPAPAQRVAFSPALEHAAETGMRHRDPDSSFASSVFPSRRSDLFQNDATPPKVNQVPRQDEPLLGSAQNGPVSAYKPVAQGGEKSLRDGEYWTSPTLDELRTWAYADLAQVPNFIVGRIGCGEVQFLEPVDLTTVPDLSDVPGGFVQLKLKECIVYPNEDEEDGFKAPPGEGLNQPALISLEQCWPLDRATRQPITDPNHPRLKQHIKKLQGRAEVEFVDFEAEKGIWRFKVQHFSRYGLDDSDEDDEEHGPHEPVEQVRRKAREPVAKTAGGSLPRTAAINRARSGRAVTEAALTEDDAPPPHAGLNDASAEETDTEDGDGDGATYADDRSSVMHESELASPPPQGGAMRVWQERASTPRHGSSRPETRERSMTPTARHERSTSQTSQPWAASLGLEPRRVQVMQASFFGQSGVPSSLERVEPKPASSMPGNQVSNGSRKHVRQGQSPEKGGLLSSDAASLQIDDSGEEFAGRKSAERSTFEALPAPVVDGYRPVRKYTRTDLAHSAVKRKDGLTADSGLSLGRSFRIGWGPDGSLVHNGVLVGATGLASARSNSPSPEQSLSTLKIERLQFRRDTIADDVANAERLLKLQLERSDIELGEDGCPVAYTKLDTRFRHLSASFDNNDRSLEASMWRLGVALFDEIDLQLPDDTASDVADRILHVRRKAALSSWLRHTVAGTVESESRSHIAASRQAALTFTYLSGKQIERACMAAVEAGDLRMATLLGQIGGDEETRADMNEQLATWRREGADAHIARDHRRIYELLAGNVTLSEGTASRTRDSVDRVEDLPIAAGLDWKRAFGLHLWYGVAHEAPLTAAFERYERAIGGASGTAPPLAHYQERAQLGVLRLKQLIQSGAYQRDALFHLLKIYSDPTHDLESALCPSTFGPLAADYRLPWHLYMLLSRVLRQRDFQDRAELGLENSATDERESVEGNSARADALTSSYAHQLELQGQWRWAAFVLLHLELASSRRKAVRELLFRNVRFCDVDAEAFLVDHLEIPREWVFEAKAFEARNRGDRFAECQLFIKAGLLSEAHHIACRYLAPEAIIRGDHDLLLSLFSPFHSSLPGWKYGGQVFVDYVACLRQIPYLLAAHEDSSGLDALNGDKLEHLARRTTELLSLVPALFPDESDLGQMVCRSEMIAALQNLARVLSNRNCGVEPHVAWDSSPPEVEAVQDIANDYYTLLLTVAG